RMSPASSRRPARQATVKPSARGARRRSRSTGSRWRLRGIALLTVGGDEDTICHSADADRLAGPERATPEGEANPAVADGDGHYLPAEQVERRVDLQHPGADVDDGCDEQEDGVADEVADAWFRDGHEREQVGG